MKAHLAAMAMLFAAPVFAFDYPVSVTTVECNGDTGMVSVDVSRIYKVQTIACENGASRKQVMIRNDAGSYDVATIDMDEAAALEQEIRTYAAARREALKNGGTVIIGN